MLNIDPKSNVPLYEQIVWQVKELCLKGVLKPREKLPSVRQLSAMILINPNTVSKAYQELERQGVIETHLGKGAFIADQPPAFTDERQKERVKQQLKRVLVDARYAGLSKQEIHDYVEEQFNHPGGMSHA